MPLAPHSRFAADYHYAAHAHRHTGTPYFPHRAEGYRLSFCCVPHSLHHRHSFRLHAVIFTVRLRELTRSARTAPFCAFATRPAPHTRFRSRDFLTRFPLYGVQYVDKHGPRMDRLHLVLLFGRCRTSCVFWILDHRIFRTPLRYIFPRFCSTPARFHRTTFGCHFAVPAPLVLDHLAFTAGLHFLPAIYYCRSGLGHRASCARTFLDHRYTFTSFRTAFSRLPAFARFSFCLPRLGLPFHRDLISAAFAVFALHCTLLDVAFELCLRSRIRTSCAVLHDSHHAFAFGFSTHSLRCAHAAFAARLRRTRHRCLLRLCRSLPRASRLRRWVASLVLQFDLPLPHRSCRPRGEIFSATSFSFHIDFTDRLRWTFCARTHAPHSRRSRFTSFSLHCVLHCLPRFHAVQRIHRFVFVSRFAVGRFRNAAYCVAGTRKRRVTLVHLHVFVCSHAFVALICSCTMRVSSSRSSFSFAAFTRFVRFFVF